MIPTRPGSGNLPAILCGVAANLLLGFSALFWKALAALPPATLLGYRILLSLATLAVVMAVLGRFAGLHARLTWRILAIHAAAAGLVVINWGAFIWASIHGHVVESGLGYLIAPFVAIAVGALALGDPTSWIRKAALAVIVAAVFAMVQRSGELQHWVYLVIGATWGGYACLKKLTTLDAFSGLLCETIVLAALLAVALAASATSLRLPGPLPDDGLPVLLALCGVVSVLPLWLFSLAAARLQLSVMGFFQFVLPTTQLFVALVFYRQAVSPNTLLCFAVIWLALGVLVCEPLARRARGTRPAA
ncbi:EamA family transporter [Pseudoduganella umbonata]|uniref:Chloramphenicol-sensitive protein RarD n=1 Tax=Pseudoduganella umbonata TaxID=864828 RepID=A0A4P8HNN3_9BURK|nr:rarD protein [Pseudoduganella umbonata]MBB3220027.1 chloramphenicol-sensitive protein RarD [Pseudoduganella umbonata]QCP10034.1 rarD protein [Pseudoduganella umbonata]